ncbi:U1 small nuclear ribonucleoprotein 70 kDa-like [Culicoides brevitarsis]|uniref:U1 small nuclear ribonucleoprotein 70 kDa-like n=1 Tax=Culicoides brevitarsis TaxID=469753 RepID=UPI00307B48C0
MSDRERNGYDRRDRRRSPDRRDRRRSPDRRDRFRDRGRDRSRDRDFGGGGRRGGGGYGDRDRRGGGRFGDRRPERRERSTDITENMEIESDKVKYVIGRGGTKIRDIQYSCRVSVQIDKSPNDSGYNNVTISGASHNIKRAKDAINEVVRRVLEFEDKDRDSRSRERERDRDRRRKYSDSD